jgi:hypothetical protein
LLHINWILFTPLILSQPPPSPFAPLLFISHPTPSPTDDSTDPRYRKGWFDLVFVAYYVVFFSFVRQSALFKICYPIARYFGIRKGDKLARFGEQGYAIIYFSFFGAWGLRIMSHLPTWWYNCPHFWIGTFVVSRCSNFKLTVNFRLPTLADDSRTQALLSHAGVLLVPAAYRPRPSSRETAERLQGTCCAPHRHTMARWVCLWFVYPRTCLFTPLFAGGVTASTSRSSGMLYMPPWMSQTFSSQWLKCSTISVGGGHNTSCLLFSSGSGRESDLAMLPLQLTLCLGISATISTSS